MTDISKFADAYRHLRFARSMREAYGYEAELERSKPPFSPPRWPLLIPLTALVYFVARALL